jgi:hypothetical protein
MQIFPQALVRCSEACAAGVVMDGVPGAEVMANANMSGGLELAKDY